MNTHEIVWRENNFGVVVDNSEQNSITAGTWVRDNTNGKIDTYNPNMDGYPKFYSPILATIGKDMRDKGIPLIVMPDEVEVAFKSSLSEFNSKCVGLLSNHKIQGSEERIAKDWFYRGYKAQSEGTYTVDDILAILNSFEASNYHKRPTVLIHDIKQKLQSLQKKKLPKAVLLEMEECEYCGGDGIYIDGDNNRLSCEKYAFHTPTKIKVNPDNTIIPIKFIYA